MRFLTLSFLDARSYRYDPALETLFCRIRAGRNRISVYLVNSWTRLRLRFLVDSPFARRNDTRRNHVRRKGKVKRWRSTLLREPPCNRCIISIKILDRISGIDRGRKSSARNVGNSQAERRTKDGKEERYSSRRNRSIYLPNRLATYRRIRWIYSCLRFSLLRFDHLGRSLLRDLFLLSARCLR